MFKGFEFRVVGVLGFWGFRIFKRWAPHCHLLPDSLVGFRSGICYSSTDLRIDPKP